MFSRHSGGTQEDIVKTYLRLTLEDIQEAVRYAAEALKNDVHISVEVGN